MHASVIGVNDRLQIIIPVICVFIAVFCQLGTERRVEPFYLPICLWVVESRERMGIVVVIVLISALLKCTPLSEISLSGAPCTMMNSLIMKSAAALAVLLGISLAITYLERLSVITNTHRFLLADGRTGPQKSICMTWNTSAGQSNDFR